MSNIVLFAVALAFALFLFAFEAWTVATGRMTISERIQRLGRSAPLVVVVVCTLAGGLMVHFFAC